MIIKTIKLNHGVMSIPFRELEFRAYLRNAEEALLTAHKTCDKERLSKIMRANKPRTQKPKNSNRHGIILIHGLLDSPFSMLSIEQNLLNKGYLVKNLLLKGHGTIPSDLLEVHYQQWIYEVLVALESFGSEVEKVSLIGLSTGALLALKAALLYPQKVSSLVLFCPAFKIRPLPQTLLPLVYRFRKYVPWLIKRCEDDFAKYRSITTNAAYQVRELGKKVRHELKRAKSLPPCYFILSEDDETISVGTALKVYQKLHAEEKQLRYYANQPSKTLNHMTVVQSCFPEEKLLNFSHVCLTISPTHPHYGKKEATRSEYQGALTAKNLSRYHRLVRNTYNPDFRKLIASIDDFLS
jgi:esterase/lipase